MPMKVLLVEDDQEICDLIDIYLKNDTEKFLLQTVNSGYQALRILTLEKFDLILLDLMLPKLDGWTLCRKIRRNSNVPIIIITARGEEGDRLLGFELGADDYLVKPFSPRELIARMKALHKRAGESVQAQQQLVFNQLTIDTVGHQVTYEGKVISLSPKEFELLAWLANRPNKASKREEILEGVWGYSYLGDIRTVDTHVKQVRDKLSKVGATDYLVTVWGVGYKFEAKP